MNYITAFARFWYDFVVGDDWTIAVAVIVTLIVLKLLASSTSIALWWILPLVVIVFLAVSLLRATRSSK